MARKSINKKTIVIEEKRKPKAKKAPKRKTYQRKQLTRIKRRMNDDPMKKTFEKHIVAPDLYGPFRYPRAGGGVATGLAVDRSRCIITGSATNIIQGVVMSTAYNLGWYPLTATTPSATVTVGTNVDVNARTVAANFINDCNLTAISMVVTYLGNPLTVKGESLLCTVPDTGLSYNGGSFYPGTIRIPTAELLKTPMRLWMKKAGPTADDFKLPSAASHDVNIPLLLTTGLPAGEEIAVDITRTWEFRSAMTDSTIYPYASQSSLSQDRNAYQDVLSELAATPTASAEAYPEGIMNDAWNLIAGGMREAAPYALDWGLRAAGSAARTLAPVIANHYMHRHTHSVGGGNRRIEL